MIMKKYYHHFKLNDMRTKTELKKKTNKKADNYIYLKNHSLKKFTNI